MLKFGYTTPCYIRRLPWTSMPLAISFPNVLFCLRAHEAVCVAHEAVCVAASPRCVAASPLCRGTRAPTCLLLLRRLRGACRWHAPLLHACKVFAVKVFFEVCCSRVSRLSARCAANAAGEEARRRRDFRSADALRDALTREHDVTVDDEMREWWCGPRKVPVSCHV